MEPNWTTIGPRRMKPTYRQQKGQMGISVEKERKDNELKKQIRRANTAPCVIKHGS
jgi:hypothetical protein